MEHPSSSPQAVLVAVLLPDTDDREFASSLAELGRLVSTLGYRTVATVTQTRSHLEPAAVIGEGKLQELAHLTGGSGRVDAEVPRKRTKAQARYEAEAAESGVFFDDDENGDPSVDETATGESPVALVAVDHDLTPSQARNLERATGVRVLDRAGVIIEIFHRHAKSRQARLEVEIARLTYETPRLRESPSGKERQRGRGAGEAALELDRRKVRDRIAELRRELVAIQQEQGVRRARRQQARRVALVGYTNAGKSSLMRALTGSDVYVENKLFATLDTTVRALYPETKPRILVSDTVGFIKKLPHDLVSSFKSTLDEALEASQLLHVVDASDPDWPSQVDVTQQVLAEIGADAIPTTLVMNKADQLDHATTAALQRQCPDAKFVSARRPEDVAQLRQHIVACFEASYEEDRFVVPYDQQGTLSDMHDAGNVVEQRYDETGIFIRYRAEPDVLARFRSKLRSPAANDLLRRWRLVIRVALQIGEPSGEVDHAWHVSQTRLAIVGQEQQE